MKRLLLSCVIASSLYAAASVRPQQLRCEYRVNPQGIDVAEPRLSWVLAGPTPEHAGCGNRRTAFWWLRATGPGGGTGDLWDSGKTDSPSRSRLRIAVSR